MNKTNWYSHTVESSSAVKRNELRIPTGTWAVLRCVLLSKRNHTQKIHDVIQSIWLSRKGKKVGMVVLHLKRMNCTVSHTSIYWFQNDCKQLFLVCLGLVLRFTTQLLGLDSKLRKGFCFERMYRFPLLSIILRCARVFIWNCLMKKDKYWRFKNRLVTSKYVLRRLMHFFFSFFNSPKVRKKMLPVPLDGHPTCIVGPDFDRLMGKHYQPNRIHLAKKKTEVSRILLSFFRPKVYVYIYSHLRIFVHTYVICI